MTNNMTVEFNDEEKDKIDELIEYLSGDNLVDHTQDSSYKPYALEIYISEAGVLLKALKLARGIYNELV